MFWGCVIDVPAPIEVYDALHPELLRASGGSVDGLVVHIGRPTRTGFQVIEVWTSQEQAERANTELIGPLMAQMASGPASLSAEQAVEEFDVHGLVLPQAGIFH